MDWHDRRRRRLGGANAGMPDRRGVATGMHTRAGWQLEGIMAGCYGHGDFAGPEAHPASTLGCWPQREAVSQPPRSGKAMTEVQSVPGVKSRSQTRHVDTALGAWAFNVRAGDQYDRSVRCAVALQRQPASEALVSLELPDTDAAVFIASIIRRQAAASWGHGGLTVEIVCSRSVYQVGI